VRRATLTQPSLGPGLAESYTAEPQKDGSAFVS
jgi:hypothetical protein